MTIGKTILILLITGLVWGCSQNRNKNQKQSMPLSKQQLEEVNKYLIEKDNELIKAYIKRRGWDMEQSGSGLWYTIEQQGNGKKAQSGQHAFFNYRVELLDGTLCYSSDSLGIRDFVIGKGGVEAGLEEGIRFLNQGAKAIFIMPPHLAHHLLGDENRVPARATIVYYIELLKLSDTN